MLLLLPYTLSRQDVLSSVAVRIVSSMSKDRGMTWSNPKGPSQIKKSMGNTAEKQSSSSQPKEWLAWKLPSTSSTSPNSQSTVENSREKHHNG